MTPRIKVGIPIIGSREWMGGVAYTELLVKAIRGAPSDQHPLLYLMVNDEEHVRMEPYLSFIHYFDGIIHTGAPDIKGTTIPIYQVNDFREGLQFVDILFPINFSVRPDFPSISWIPDFQHKHLPHLFAREDFQDREQRALAIAQNAKMVVFSSEDAKRDFQQFYPQSKTVTKVLHFYSLPQKSWYEFDPWVVANKYGIKGTFAICCNQLWKHKNHLLLFEAVKQLREEGIRLDLICTGSVTDYRNPDYYQEVVQYLQDQKLTEQIRLLGFIPREDQIQLIRASSFLVQPSLFEGWSTVVEDGRVLGKRMILSDLNVHLEQNPKYALFFDRSNSLSLKAKIVEMMDTSDNVSNAYLEVACQEDAALNIHRYYQDFVDIVNLGLKLHQNQVSVLVICRPVEESDTEIAHKTLISIQRQTLELSMAFGNLGSIDLNQYDADFVFLIENGDEFDSKLIESLIRFIQNEDQIVICGVAKTNSVGKILYAPVYPDEHSWNNALCFGMSRIIASRSLLLRLQQGSDDDLIDSGFQIASNCYIKRKLNDDLTRQLKGKRKLMIYGAGEHTRELMKQFDFSTYSIVALLDKNFLRYEGSFGEIPIISPERIREFEFDSIVISSHAFENEIFRELELIYSVDPLKMVKLYNN